MVTKAEMVRTLVADDLAREEVREAMEKIEAYSKTYECDSMYIKRKLTSVADALDMELT